MDAGAIYDDRPTTENLPHLLSGINLEYIGETHQALEQELDYQTFLEDELKKYVARGLYSQHDAVNLQTLININREHLESLSPITSLEHMFSEISQKVSDRAVDLVTARDSPAFWDRNLSKNMRACWKTVQRFSHVSRVHISNASEYQMFYYNCDHFIKSLQKKAEINYNRYRHIDTDYPSVSTSRLNTFMTEGLSKFQSLASEVMRLMDKAQRVNPVYLRVRGLNRPVSGIMLCDYSTKNFSLRAGQHVFVLNNAYVTPLSSNSDATDGSEASECSTCSYCCGLHHNHHPDCENYEVQLSTTVTETTPTEVGTDAADHAQEAPVVMRRGQLSDVSSVTEETNGSSEESTVNSSPGCSHTFCSQREPVIWKVRTSDGSLTVDVPAVTVMINERDDEAIAHAHEIYEFFTNMWREAIDIWLTKGVKALTNYFSTLIEAKYIRLESERIFQQFLDGVQRAFPIQDPESASANKILNEMIETLREKIRRQVTREEATEEVYVRITEVATYRKTVQKVRDHVNHIKRFMKDVEENTRRGYIDTTTLKSMGDLKYVYEETVEEHRKLERMLRQVNAFRTGRRSPRVPVQTIHSTYGKYYSSAGEYSSESEESQYDVERSKNLSPRILYGREETHRTTALTDRPRHVRRPRGGVAGEELPADSSDESDAGKPRRSSRFLYKPTHGRRDEQVSEIIEETNDTVISSMTLDRKINFAKQIRRPDEINISPDERYRSRRQYHVPPGPQKGDVSMVYLQITTAKSTQDTMSPTDDNRQSRGIQIDIETIPVDAKDVLQVEPRVASWQKNAVGGMILRHDVSLDPIQSERERRSVPERTMEAIVSGTVQNDDYYDRGVQVTSRDEYKGIMKPPMYDYMQSSTQTADYAEPMEVIKHDQTEMVHADSQIPENRYIVSSFTEVPKVTIGLISSSLIRGQTDTAITAPRSEISTTISAVTQNTVEEFIPSTISVSTEQLLHVEDAWTEAAIVEEDQVPTIKQIRTVGEKSAPPVERVHQIVKVRPCQTSKPLVHDFETQARIDTQRMGTIVSLSEEPLEEVITGSEIKNTEFIPKTGREQVVHTKPPVLEGTDVVSVATSWTETPRVLEEIYSDWITNVVDRGIIVHKIAVKSAVTSSEKVPEPRIIQINANTQTESEYISRGMRTMVVEEMMPPITVMEASKVRAVPVIEPRVSIRYCQSSTPLHIHYEGITASEEATTKVPGSKPRMHSIELQAQMAAERLVTITHANEEERRQLKGIGINTEDLKTYLDAWTEAFAVEEPERRIVQEQTVEVKAKPVMKPIMHSRTIQAIRKSETMDTFTQIPKMSRRMNDVAVGTPVTEYRTTAIMTKSMIEPSKPVVIHAFAPAKPLEIVSTGLDIGQKDIQTGVHREDLLTTVSSVVEHPIRQSEVTIGAEVKYSDAQTTGEAVELRTLVSSWVEEVIIGAIPARVVEAPPPLPMTPLPISVRYSGVQTVGKKHLEAASSTESTEYRTSLSGRLEAVKPMNIHEAQTIIEEKIVKPVMISTGIQSIEESVTSTKVAKPSSVSTEWVVELKDRSLLTETPLTTDVSTTETPLEIHTVVSSALQAEPDGISKEVVAEPVVLAAPPVKLRFGKVQTQIQQYSSTATMASRELTSTEPEIVTVPKPKVSDFAGQVFIGAEIHDAVSGVSEALATQLKDAETQVEIEPVRTKISSHVGEKRIAYVTSSTETPLVGEITTAAMTEVRIEPTQPVVVHSIPPAPQKIIGTEAIGIRWLAELRKVEVQAVGEVKEKPITLSVASQVDLIPFQTGVTTHVSEVVLPTPPTPESVMITTGLIREHNDVNIAAPEVQISSTISSVVETEKPKIIMHAASIETERSAQLLSTGAETEEAIQIIKKDSVSVVHVAPPIPSLTPVKFGRTETAVKSFIEKSTDMDKVKLKSASVHTDTTDYRSTATITETMVESTRVSVQTIRPPQPSPITTSSKFYLDQINTGISPPTMELSTTVSSIPKVSISSLGIMTELMAVQADGWTQADYVEPEPVIQPRGDTLTVETAPPVQPTRVRIGGLQTPYQIHHEGVTSEVGVKKPLAEVEISSAQCPVPAKVTLETATSQYIYVPKRSEALTVEVTPPKPAMRTYEVQVSLPQAELMSSALEVSQVDVGIPAPERIVVVSRGVETITIEEPGPMIKPVEVIGERAAPPLIFQPSPVKIRYGKTETPIQDRHAPETPKFIMETTATMTETYLETVSSSYAVVQTDTDIMPEAEGTITAVSSALDKGIPRRSAAVETDDTEAAIVKYAATQSAPASKGPERIHTSTMTTEVVAPKEVKLTYAIPPAPVLPNLTDSEMQTQKTSVSESLTMTEFTKQKSINLQTEEEYIWDVDIPAQERLKCLPVETVPAIKKNSNIQCSLMESPPELVTEVKGSKEFEYETIQVDETTYKFTDTQVTETMTKKVPLVEWAGFAPSTGFNNTECSQEFYELFRAVRQSVWDRCVTEELEEYFGNVGYAMLNRSIYEEVLSRCYLREYAGQTETEEGVTTAEVGLQFPYEVILQEPFEDGITTKTEAVVVESYLSRLRRGVISESEIYAIPAGTDFEIQVRMEPEKYVQSPIQIIKTTESFAYKQPLALPKVISIDQCEQTDATLVSTTTHLQQKTDVKTALSEITDVVHVLDEPEYVKTQVYISTVTEGSQTEPLSYEYLSEMLKRQPRPQPSVGRDRHDCLHDLDITTYFFDEDALEEEYYQRLYEVEIFSPLGELITERMPITVRQRVVEYELCDMTTQIDARDWDNIREVASPITGLFAPVSFAVRQGWIQLGGRNEYIDPTTGHAIPLETALAQGRIRLAAGASTTTTTPSSLMYIEREYIAQETVEAIFVLNTETREYTSIRQARLDGLISEDVNHATWVLNKVDNVWLTAEEAISQNILRVDRARDTETEEEVKRRQLQSVVRAYHVTAVRPGGEPSEWLRPDDAVRLGLFDRQTGKIAVEWPARPSYHLFEDGRTPSVEEGVSLWCNFLTARQAGWIRLIPEMNINKWIPLSQPSGSSGNRRLLSTAVSLVSSSKPNNDRPGPYRTTSYQRTRHLQSERGQYTSYTSGSMAPRRLGSDSHSPDYGTEDSRTPPYLTEVGEFEHTEAYTLPSRQVTTEERIAQLEEVSSFRTLEEGDGQFYSYPTTTYATEESMSTVRHEFEETHSYTDPTRGQYIRDQSPSVWSRGQRIEPHSDYSRSGYLSRSSESEQRR